MMAWFLFYYENKTNTILIQFGDVFVSSIKWKEPKNVEMIPMQELSTCRYETQFQRNYQKHKEFFEFEYIPAIYTGAH